MNEFFSIANLIYWALIITTVLATTAIIGPLWRRHENARWTLGYFIIFFYGWFMVGYGGWDANTYLALFFGVGFAGIVKVGYELIANSLQAQRLRQRATEIVSGIIRRITGEAEKKADSNAQERR